LLHAWWRWLPTGTDVPLLQAWRRGFWCRCLCWLQLLLAVATGAGAAAFLLLLSSRLSVFGRPQGFSLLSFEFFNFNTPSPWTSSSTSPLLRSLACLPSGVLTDSPASLVIRPVGDRLVLLLHQVLQLHFAKSLDFILDFTSSQVTCLPAFRCLHSAFLLLPSPQISHLRSALTPSILNIFRRSLQQVRELRSIFPLRGKRTMQSPTLGAIL